MKIKTLSQGSNTPYKVGGLIFPSKDRYVDLKGIDSGVDIILDYTDIDEVCSFLDKIKPVEVIETYPGARKEIDGLFQNLTRLNNLGGDEIFYLKYLFAKIFLKKFKYRE